MTLATIRARLSCVAVEAKFADSATRARDTFAALWSATALRPYVAAIDLLRTQVTADSTGFLLQLDDQTPTRVGDERLLVPLIELAMYERFLDAERTARRAVLHACGFVHGDTTYICGGESGAGKSAIARAAIAAGCEYFADEHLVTDGEFIWGVPRAIHLDLEPIETPPAPWHVGVNRESYTFPGEGGRMLRLPFLRLDPTCIAERRRPLSQAVLVALKRGDHDLALPLDAAGRLSLVQRAHFLEAAALARVALVPRAFSLSWREPGAALQQLLVVDNDARGFGG